MSSVNDSSNHFMVFDAISREMKSVGKIGKITRLEEAPRGDGGKQPHLAEPRGDCRKEGLFRRQEG
jgi:hypothetical protein